MTKPAAPDPAPLAPPPRDPRQPADFDPVLESKRRLRAIRAGALGAIEADGRPFVSLVNVATDIDGAPLLLLSGLSRHTGLLGADARCSLLLAETGKGDPLAHPRLTVIGRAARDTAPRVRARFLARHPKSKLYADFPDFSFWRIEPDSFHINGGFARAAELQPGHVLTSLAGADELADIEPDAVQHMNQDHPEALQRYASAAKAGAGPWRASGIDPEGIDLASGDRTARLFFPQRVVDGRSLRATLVALGKDATTKD